MFSGQLDLHSFPTRRSSDLRGWDAAPRESGCRRVGGARRAAPGGCEEFAADGGRRALRRAGVQDRKSTRLNSSHSQISYAVFCLKKKKSQKLKRITNKLLMS